MYKLSSKNTLHFSVIILINLHTSTALALEGQTKFEPVSIEVDGKVKACGFRYAMGFIDGGQLFIVRGVFANTFHDSKDRPIQTGYNIAVYRIQKDTETQLSLNSGEIDVPGIQKEKFLNNLIVDESNGKSSVTSVIRGDASGQTLNMPIVALSGFKLSFRAEGIPYDYTFYVSDNLSERKHKEAYDLSNGIYSCTRKGIVQIE